MVTPIKSVKNLKTQKNALNNSKQPKIHHKKEEETENVPSSVVTTQKCGIVGGSNMVITRKYEKQKDIEVNE